MLFHGREWLTSLGPFKKSQPAFIKYVPRTKCYLVILLPLMVITPFKKCSAENTVIYMKYTIYCEGCWLFQTTLCQLHFMVWWKFTPGLGGGATRSGTWCVYTPELPPKGKKRYRERERTSQTPNSHLNMQSELGQGTRTPNQDEEMFSGSPS